jgi:hypothetical protein
MGFGATDLGAATFFGALFFGAAFFAVFFAAFFAVFFAAFFGAAFLADFFADFLAAFLADFFEALFADFAITNFFFLSFLPFLLFFPLAIVILLLPPIRVHQAFSKHFRTFRAEPFDQFGLDPGSLGP